MSFKTTSKVVINLPGGRVYEPKSDDLLVELVEAAKSIPCEAFNVKIDGMLYETPESLPTNTLSALIKTPEIIPVVEVSVRDTAGI